MLDIQKIHDAIDEFVLKGGAEEYDVRIPDNSKKKREYLGLSALGAECVRSVWYDFRKVAKKSFPSRMLRLFRSQVAARRPADQVLRAIQAFIDRSIDPIGKESAAGKGKPTPARKASLKKTRKSAARALPEKPRPTSR